MPMKNNLRRTILSQYPRDYLTFTAIESGTFGFTYFEGAQGKLQYTRNDGISWNEVNDDIEVYENEVIKFKGNLIPNSDSNIGNVGIGNFNSSGQFIASGNTMSIIYGDDFGDKTDMLYTYNFANLFKNCVGLVNIEEIKLPATNLTQYCYQSVFEGCISLTSIPENLLPATTLAKRCYEKLFRNTGLNEIPKKLLPATTLASGCYVGIFENCTSLTTTPELPATTITQDCYESMFSGCISLTNLPEKLLPATEIPHYSYQNMFRGCTSLTTVPNDLLAFTKINVHSCSGMFYGCTKLSNMPELPATKLNGRFCYYMMFSYCTSLTEAPQLPATTLSEYCYSGMFYGCTSLTNAPELPATTLASGCYNNMFCNCSKLNYIKMLAIDISATNCLNSWVYGVASNGTFIKNSEATWDVTGVSGIPEGWTVENDDIVEDNNEQTEQEY